MKLSFNKIVSILSGKDIGVLNESSELDVNMAVEKAKEAQKEWSKITANERGKLMIEAARNLKVLLFINCFVSNTIKVF